MAKCHLDNVAISGCRRPADVPLTVTVRRGCGEWGWACCQIGTIHKARFPSRGLGRVCERPPFIFQKAVFYTLKGHVLRCKRRPFATHWHSGRYATDLQRRAGRKRPAMHANRIARRGAGRAKCKLELPQGDITSRRVTSTPYIITRAWQKYP